MANDKAKCEARSPECKNSGEATCYVQGTFLWYEIDAYGLPLQANDEFYGDRYSKPVHIANSVTGQVEQCTVVYDYLDGGWCMCGLPDGLSCNNYELMLPTHFCYLPPFSR
jgi:hypothetical protein